MRTIRFNYQRISKKNSILYQRRAVLFHQVSIQGSSSSGNVPRTDEKSSDSALPIESLDLDPSDFHLFRFLQNNLYDKYIDSLEAVQNYFKQNHSFYKEGIQKFFKISKHNYSTMVNFRVSQKQYFSSNC